MSTLIPVDAIDLKVNNTTVGRTETTVEVTLMVTSVSKDTLEGAFSVLYQQVDGRWSVVQIGAKKGQF